MIQKHAGQVNCELCVDVNVFVYTYYTVCVVSVADWHTTLLPQSMLGQILDPRTFNIYMNEN